MSVLFRTLFRTLAPLGRDGRLSVLIFHRVLANPDPLRPGEPTAETFEAILRWVDERFNVIPLSDAVSALKNESLPERSLAITFDDGYADNKDNALPILLKLGLSATFFIATGYLDGGRMFNDIVIEAIREARGDVLDLSDMALGSHPIGTVAERGSAVNIILGKLKYVAPGRRESVAEAIADRAGARPPTNLMMSSKDVLALHRAGMDIGAHTVSHPILKEIDLAMARQEIDTGRKHLETIIGERIRLFAYPNGRPGSDYGSDHVALVRELGFDAAVTTEWGSAGRGADLFQIPRFTPWNPPGWKFGLRMAQNLLRDHRGTNSPESSEKTA